MKELCEEYGRSFEEMSAWYDGYELTAVENGRLKTYSMYNPKSVVDAMISGMFDNYWNQTETYDALKIYIRMNYDGLKDDVIRMLAGDRVLVNTGTFSNDMTTFQGKDDVLTLLIHLGYLSYHWQEKTVSIPNKEVAQEYVNAIGTMGWKEVMDSIEKSRKLLEVSEVCAYADGEIRIQPLYQWQDGCGLVPVEPLLHREKLERAGVKL